MRVEVVRHLADGAVAAGHGRVAVNTAATAGSETGAGGRNMPHDGAPPFSFATEILALLWARARKAVARPGPSGTCMLRGSHEMLLFFCTKGIT